MLSPTELRARVRTAPAAAPGTLSLRLPFRKPLFPDNLFGHLAATGVPGVEEWRDGAYRRTLRLPRGPAVVALKPEDGYIGCRLTLSDLRDLSTAISRCRRLLDLDADPGAVDELLAADPMLAPMVAAAPGRRVPRTVDGDEFAVRAVLGQQVSTAAARTHAARLVTAYGEPIDDPDGELTHVFPDTAALAELDPESIAMRSLGDPDAFLPTDLGVKVAAREFGLSPAALVTHAERWRPWRAYAVQHLWATGDHPINRLPAAS